MPMRIIGLTGGVSMGKTTVSRYLHDRYSLPILDADLYARQVVEPGTELLAKIVVRYGDTILQTDGTLDRRKLANILFSNPAERYWLEQLIHPAVRRKITGELEALAAQNEQTAVVVVPLLFEAQMQDLVTEIWVVYTTATQQQARLAQRDSLTPEQVQARISSQMPIQQKTAQADILLDNSATLPNLFNQIDQAYCLPLQQSISL